MRENMKRLFLIMGILISLAACATPYEQARKPTAEGYFDTNLQDKVYDVTFNGNSDTNFKIAKDYALLRAAEVCLENGYQTFQIINTENNSIEDMSVSTHTVKYSTGYSYSYSTVSESNEPQISIVVLCSPANDLFFKAQDLKDSLRAKYRIK